MAGGDDFLDIQPKCNGEGKKGKRGRDFRFLAADPLACARNDDDLAMYCKGANNGHLRFASEPAAPCKRKMKICVYAELTHL